MANDETTASNSPSCGGGSLRPGSRTSASPGSRAAFFGQSANAHDSEARATVNTVVKPVEACRVNAPAYASCETPAALADSGVSFAGAPGQAGVAIADQGFLVYAISKGTTAGKNHGFAWQRNGDGTRSRFCLNSALQPLNGGGCRNSTW